MNTTNIPRYKASMPMQTQFITNADGCGDQVFTQIKRQGNVAIYSRTDPETDRVVGYEVIVISTVKAGTVYVKGGKPTEHASESYPGCKSFGKSGWACVSIGQAENKFSQVVKDEQTTVPVMEISKQVEQESADIPVGEFTQTQFATMNCMPPRGIVYNVLQTLIDKGLVKLSRRVQMGPGRPTSLYIKA